MKLSTSDDKLTVVLQGLEIFLGLRYKLEIPRTNISDISWHERYSINSRLWRLAGSGIVGVINAGIFSGGGKRYFLYLRQPKGISWSGRPIETTGVLVIKAENYGFSEIVLTLPADEADRVTNWWRTTSDT